MIKKENYSYKTRKNEALITRMIIVFVLLTVAVFSLLKTREWVSVRSWLGPISDYGNFFTVTSILTLLSLVLTIVTAVRFVKLRRAKVDESLKPFPSSMMFTVSAVLLLVLLLISNFVYTGFSVAIIFVIMVSLLYFISVCFPGSYLIMTVFNALGAFVIYALQLVSPINNPVLHYALRILAVLVAFAFIAVIYKAHCNGGEVGGVRILKPDADVLPITVAAILFTAFIILGMFEIGSYIIYDVIIALETIIFALFYAIKTLK